MMHYVLMTLMIMNASIPVIMTDSYPIAPDRICVAFYDRIFVSQGNEFCLQHEIGHVIWYRNRTLQNEWIDLVGYGSGIPVAELFAQDYETRSGDLKCLLK